MPNAESPVSLAEFSACGKLNRIYDGAKHVIAVFLKCELMCKSEDLVDLETRDSWHVRKPRSYNVKGAIQGETDADHWNFIARLQVMLG